ncbi:MAG: hypothetical protein QM642_11455 [Edaphocola sp.]
MVLIFTAVMLFIPELAGNILIGGDNGNNQNITVAFPVGTPEGTVLSMPTSASVSFNQYTDSTNVAYVGYGKMKVIANNSTTFEGYFYCDLHIVPSMVKSGTIKNGYFKITK